MILLWGLEEDAPLAGVRMELERLGAPVFFLDHRCVLDCHADVEFTPWLKGSIEAPNGTLRLNDVRAAYLRPYNFRDFPSLAERGPESAEWRHSMLFEDILWSWAEMAEALVLNRPLAMTSNNSKPYQARLIERCGLRTPETLVTTSRSSTHCFLERHGEVIYKSVSGVRSIVSRLSPARIESLADVAWCPTQFQAHVPGIDHRVHVVGDELYACSVESSADDYRYHAARMKPCTLPDDVATCCYRLSSALHLPLCGIDLRQTTSGEWFCFEVNPSPAYSCFDAATGSSIRSAIARLLVSG